MKKVLIFVFLLFSIITIAQMKFGIIGFYSPYEISYSGWNSIISFNDDQYRPYDFTINEPPLHLSATHSLAFGISNSIGILNISCWLDMAMFLGGGRNEFRMGTVRRNFESGYALRILSYHYHNTLVSPLSADPYYITFNDQIFDPTETDVTFLHRIYNFRSGFYSTFHQGDFWLSVAYYPGLLDFNIEAAGVKISDGNHSVFFPYNPAGTFSFLNDEFSISLGFYFRIF